MQSDLMRVARRENRFLPATYFIKALGLKVVGINRQLNQLVKYGSLEKKKMKVPGDKNNRPMFHFKVLPLQPSVVEESIMSGWRGY